MSNKQRLTARCACGHSLAQHSSGMCDIKGCECNLYFPERRVTYHDVESFLGSMLVAWSLFFLVFVIIWLVIRW